MLPGSCCALALGCSEPSSRSLSSPAATWNRTHSASCSRQIVDAEQRRDAADRNGPAISHPPHLAGTRGASGNQKLGRPRATISTMRGCLPLRTAAISQHIGSYLIAPANNRPNDLNHAGVHFELIPGIAELVDTAATATFCAVLCGAWRRGARHLIDVVLTVFR